MRLNLLWPAALVLVTACGSSSNPVTQPPPPTVASVTVTGAPLAPIAPGATVTLTATLRDADGATLSGRTVTWTTSAAAVATVSSNGTVTAAAPGTATITATSEGKSDDAQITVAAPVPVPTSITIQRSSSWLLTGDTLHLGVQVRDADGNLIEGLTPTVTVAEGTGATLSGSVLTATSAGTVVVRATQGTLSSSATIVIFPGSGVRRGEIAKLDSVVISRMREAQIPGGALTIVKDGRLVLERTYGYADTLVKRIPDKDDLWRIGSLSKPITAIGIMKLVQNGVLMLTEAAAPRLNAVPLLPGKTEDSRFASITIRQLLEHTGGWNANREVDDTLWAHAFTGTIDPIQLSRIARGVQLAYNPGAVHGYTNYAYLLLARVIEQVTGQPYEAWMKANVMAPAGVTRMALGRTPLAQRLPTEVKPYDRSPPVTGLFGTGSWADVTPAQEYSEASGQWVGSATDVARILASVDGNGVVPDQLNATSLANFRLRNNTAWPSGSYYYSLGFAIDGTGSTQVLTHTGGQTGGDGWFIMRADGLIAVLLFNLTRAQTSPNVDVALLPVINSITTWPTGVTF